jgi:membrane peptidoglycan carboxypeptidase
MGVDIIAKASALRDNIRGGSYRGGSTITEQYIKNRYFRDSARTISQKLREALWAIVAEMRYTKAEILTHYLDSIYMGNGIYGLETARSKYWPDSTLENLGESAIIEIITRLRYPNLSA